MPVKIATADVLPMRQPSQYACMATSLAMALRANGVPAEECTTELVNKVVGALPMKGAAWEHILAGAQHYGMRATLVVPATLRQVKAWTDRGVPVMIAWNPEGRDWSHASLVYDVTEGLPASIPPECVVQGEGSGLYAWVADPNIPNPDKTTRIVHEDTFYSKWSEKWPDYLVRRPACAIEREITPEGRQVVANGRHRRAAMVYPWEMREELRQFQWALKPKDISDGTSDMSVGVFFGFARGSVPGGKGTYTVLSPEEFERAKEMGWVTPPGKKVKYHEAQTANYGNLNLVTYDKVLTTLTDEGQWVVGTPLKELILKRSPLQGRLEDLALVYEDLLYAGENVRTILEDRIYKGKDPWDPRSTGWYKSLQRQYSGIVTPHVYEDLLRRPLNVTGWLADLWDLDGNLATGFPTQWLLFMNPRGPKWEEYLRGLVYRAFYEDLGPEKIKQALGAREVKNLQQFHQPLFKGAQAADLKKIILQEFPNDITQGLKDVLSGKAPAGKTVVDSQIARKIEILKRLPGNPAAEKLIEIYESGTEPSDEDLKEIRHQLYRNRMRDEANHFRTASTGAECEFYKARDGQWYMALSDNPPDDDDEREYWEPEYEHYGPFASFDEAEEYLSRNHANPGGYSEDKSGRRAPPRHPLSPRRRWAGQTQPKQALSVTKKAAREAIRKVMKELSRG